MAKAKKRPAKKKKSSKSKAVPTNPALYARVKAEAKRKFKVYPSAYANGWLVRTYKKRGGGYRTKKA
jgi:K+-transporting ATPase c subunit|tara:strand:+ start:648 stop:848 length:201 start_codon:yes stop_codon:yes gene_type:complete